MKKGKVFLVGAGPGDPGLLTVKGRRCLQQAEVVIYDNLCNPSLLKEVPQKAKIIFGGKHSGLQSLSQIKIERWMVRYALSGKYVVRLKGGDPFVFGRGAEECATLQKHGIEFEVVPGVTSAIAVPAYAGIPVTHRDCSSGFTVVTAYEDPNKSQTLLDYKILAQFPGTLVFLMGVKRLKYVAENLISHGKSPHTPVALIRWGTRTFQQTLIGKLADISSKIEKVGFRPPSVIVIGEVVRCRKEIQWFERRPLFGRRIVITRAQEQAGELSERLWELGAEVLELPTIQIERVKSAAVCRSIKKVADFDWVILTSPWAAEFFLDSVLEEHGDIRVLSGIKFAVIGPTTASKLRARGLSVALQPVIHTSEGFAAHCKRLGNWQQKRVLLPRSNIARDVLELTLRRLEARVHPVVIYRNKAPKPSWQVDALYRMGADEILFTSSSTVKNFEQLLRNRNLISHPMRKLLRQCRMISIGPTTSDTLRKLGFRVHAQAKEASVEGLIRCLTRISCRA